MLRRSQNIKLPTYQKELVESRNPDREKLKSDYSLLQSSDLRVEVALWGSTVKCQLLKPLPALRSIEISYPGSFAADYFGRSHPVYAQVYL
ncbi:MAG: hypothetical protein EAZ25_17350 [Oscillatoriales cyanobacterium]|nr:MAG: hypothetical protein EAZ86_14475 [Oscillatoriales cyanobacterium]TAG65119.1 MAG: hypothetical protein EAZ25_17350 [Oscillatoriales cyanobacterium]